MHLSSSDHKPACRAASFHAVPQDLHTTPSCLRMHPRAGAGRHAAQLMACSSGLQHLLQCLRCTSPAAGGLATCLLPLVAGAAVGRPGALLAGHAAVAGRVAACALLPQPIQAAGAALAQGALVQQALQAVLHLPQPCVSANALA